MLYRLSIGHGGIFCEGCHGSTHAEWPNSIANANDNIAANRLQGHSGKIVECATCHGNTLTISDFRGKFDANGFLPGPHGMHPVDQSWISGHQSVFRDSPDGCVPGLPRQPFAGISSRPDRRGQDIPGGRRQNPGDSEGNPGPLLAVP